jgi:hypothetical protein
MEETISPAEAFRMLLRAFRPRAKAREIDSYDWFRCEFKRPLDCCQHEVDDAKTVILLLCNHVESGRIRLEGVVAEGTPRAIDVQEQIRGRLDVFEANLKIYGRTLHPMGAYSAIRCVKADVRRIASDLKRGSSKATTGGE